MTKKERKKLLRGLEIHKQTLRGRKEIVAKHYPDNPPEWMTDSIKETELYILKLETLLKK